MSSLCEPAAILIAKHKAFLKRCLSCFPQEYQSLDTTRLTLLFFTVSGLDVLGAIDEISPDKKKELIDWIYSFQLTTKRGTLPKCCGFRGAVVSSFDQNGYTNNSYESGHLAMTYSALCCLLILGDDLSRVDRLGVLANVKACQLPDGSFCATPGGSENDTRFVYCAACICFMLDDWRAFNAQEACGFIRRSLSFDGGIAQGPLLESHGGSTYCAVASLKMLNKLSSTFSSREVDRLKKWCIRRQEVGFHGRANKPDDSCYTFWIGATLKMLGLEDKVDVATARSFTISTQDKQIGGFGKYSDSFPDALHTYLSLSGLSVLGETALSKLDPALNITVRAASQLRNIHTAWPVVELPKINCCAES